VFSLGTTPTRLSVSRLGERYCFSIPLAWAKVVGWFPFSSPNRCPTFFNQNNAPSRRLGLTAFPPLFVSAEDFRHSFH